MVVDNDSHDGVPGPDGGVGPGPACRYCSSPTTQGFAAGVNAGWRLARSPWLLLAQSRRGSREGGSCSQVCATTRANTMLIRDGPPGIVGFGLAMPTGRPRARSGSIPPGPDRPGAVDTALAAEIPGRLANSLGPGRLGHRRVHARQHGDDRRPRRNGRGFLPLLRRSGLQPRRPTIRLASRI